MVARIITFAASVLLVAAASACDDEPSDLCAKEPAWEGVAPVAIEGAPFGSHFCAVLENGGVRCWGSNFYGQCGDDSAAIEVARTPVIVHGLSCAAQVSAGGGSTCAVLKDRSVHCWGDNASGSLGDGSLVSSARPVEVPGVIDVIQMQGAAFHFAALDSNGRTLYWGPRDEGRPVPPTPLLSLTDVERVAYTWGGGCVIHGGGRVACWGENARGQLGDGTLNDRDEPRDIEGIDDAIHLSVTLERSCVVRNDGSVWCWGSGHRGGLGNGGEADASTPTLILGIGAANQVEVSSASHACARLRDGSVWCWGGESFGALGAEYPTDQLVPVEVAGVHGAVDLAVSAFATCVLDDASVISCWGGNAARELGAGINDAYRATPAQVKW